MKIRKKILMGSLGSVLGLLAMATAPAIAASSFSDHLWQFAGGGATSVIDFNLGSSKLINDSQLYVTTDDWLILQAGQKVIVSNGLAVGGAVEASSIGTAGNATVGGSLSTTGNATVGGSLSTTGNATVGGDLNAASVTLGNGTAHNGTLTTDISWADGASDSSQPVAADLHLAGARGSGTAFETPIMGHLHGDALTGGTSTYHAGVIGGYSVTTSDGTTGPKAGVIGSVNIDGGSIGVADAAVMAVLDGGDPGDAATADAAYGVQYINANSSAKFDYGLDLSHAAVGDIEAVSFGKADIRLSNGQEVYTGTATTRAAVRSQAGTQGAIGSVYLSSAGKMYLKVAAAGADTDWQKVTTTAAD